MKKILLVTSQLGNAGASKWVLDTVRTLDRTGLQIDSYFWDAPKSEQLLPEYEQIGVHIYIHELKGPVLIRLSADLQAFIKEHGPYDAMHVNDPPMLMHAVCVYAAERMGVPVRIVHFHNPNRKKLGLLGRAVRRCVQGYVFRHASYIVACSECVLTSKFGQRVIGDPKLRVLKNGIETERFRFSPEDRAAVRQELGLGESEYVILHVGRFSPEKNQLFLLDVLRLLRDQGEPVRLVLVGDGQCREDIERKIKALGVESAVILPGWQEQTARWYSAADAFVLPSWYEGFSTSALEAMTNGLPCLLSDKITAEVDVIGTVRFLPLEASAWAAALGGHPARYEDACAQVQVAGYDLRQTAGDFRALLMEE